TSELRTRGVLATADGASISGGTVTAPIGENELFFICDRANVPNVNLTVSSPITNNGGALDVIKSGRGTLTLTGASTYSGETVLHGGTVILTGSGALSNTSAITLDRGVVFQIVGNEGNTSRIPQTAPIHMLGATLAAVLNGNVVIGDII